MDMVKIETKKWHNLVDKSDWPRGKWDDELDRIQWLNMKSGYQCLVIRNSQVTGGLCGYVCVPKTSKVFKMDYGLVYDLGNVDVHGGLTFSSEGEAKYRYIDYLGERMYEGSWWFGFDCGHLNDYNPKLHATMTGFGMGDNSHYEEDVYRDMIYVMNETKSLAEQLMQFEE